MKHILAIMLFFITIYSMSGFFGGLDIDEITEVQEKAFQAGRSCTNGEYLDACDDLIKYYKKQSELFSEHEEEITDGIKDGEPSYKRVVERARRLQSRVDNILRMKQ